MTDLLFRPAPLVLISALGYAGATLAMKASAHSPAPALLALVAFCLGTAVMAEIAAMRRLALGVTYVTILGLETLAVLAAACLLGDQFGPREMLGGACILLGTLILAA
ncbi:hypothetical protein [Oceaniglobus roseus]|uniref:hypothetical protein n=1 Tax=Oceaniglobus roseus TaxID=1737570 RepID=UPI000C7EAD51|nr:hypothetical protein [Kandeliimicrobium roseum]